MGVMDIIRAKNDLREMDATIPSCVEKMARDFTEFLDGTVREKVNNRTLLGAKVTAPSLNGDFRVAEVLAPEDGDEFPRLRCMAWHGGVREVTLSIRDVWHVGERVYAVNDGGNIPLGSTVLYDGEEVLVVGNASHGANLDVHKAILAESSAIGDMVECFTVDPSLLDYAK